MNLERLPFRAGVEQYQIQARELLEAFNSGDSEAVQFFHQNHPQFRHAKIAWLPREVPESEIKGAAFDLAGAQLALARWYDFQTWQTLAEYVEAVTKDDSPVFQFESGIEAVITGDLPTLESSLRKNPELVRARSTRITPFDPPVHRATLLHYVAANGVEGYRQKSPPNAVEIAKALLQAGAEVDAFADLYGRPCTTMSLLVSSCHPANAGVQVALVETLLDFGAAIEGRGGQWGKGGKENGSPLTTALAFGYRDAADALVRRGARVDDLPTAAGLGRFDDAARLLPTADAASRHAALALAAQHGHIEIVRLLLDAGEDPNRYNPKGHHDHSTPLHQAIAGGHDAMVRLLIERGARLDIKDTIWQGTPVGWAEHLGKTDIENYLRARRIALNPD
jgi:ankyrin repeat protein